MKKIISALAFVFASGTIANAENSSKETLNNYDAFLPIPDCFTVATDAARMYANARGLSYEQEHELWLYYWDRCNMQ